MMYHASPHMRAFDPHSGDYGLGFFGNALETGAYYVVDAALGPLCFLCVATPQEGGGGGGGGVAMQEGGGGGGGGVAIEPRDAYRISAYLEPLGLYVQSECGRFSRLVYDGRQSVQVEFEAGSAQLCAVQRLKLTKQALQRPGTGFAVRGAPLVRGAYESASLTMLVTFSLEGAAAAPVAAA